MKTLSLKVGSDCFNQFYNSAIIIFQRKSSELPHAFFTHSKNPVLAMFKNVFGFYTANPFLLKSIAQKTFTLEKSLQ